MFETEYVPFRFANIEHRTMEKDEKEIALVELTLELNPLTAELAAELDDFVKRTLFTVSAAEINSKLKAASFTLPLRPQQIAIRMAPDQGKATLVIDEAQITTIKAKRSKKSSAWTLVVKAKCAPPSDKHLGLIVDCYLKTRYLTWANAVPTLFDEDERTERKGRARAVAAPVESAATH